MENVPAHLALPTVSLATMPVQGATDRSGRERMRLALAKSPRRVCLEQTAPTASQRSGARERIELSAKLIDRGLRNAFNSRSRQRLVTHLVDCRSCDHDQP